MTLEVGQHVWVETYSFLGGKEKERDAKEYVVVEANGTSSYIVESSRLREYHSNEAKYRYMKVKVNQRSHKIENLGFMPTQVLWTTLEAFDNNVKHQKHHKRLKELALKKVEKMSVSELAEFVGEKL